MERILTFLVTAGSLWVAVWIVDGLRFDGEWWEFLIVAAILGVANAIVKPVLTIFSLPFIVLTLGLFLVVVNALTLQFTVWLSGPDVLDLGLTSDGFWWSTVFGAVIISIAGWIIGAVVPEDD